MKDSKDNGTAKKTRQVYYTKKGTQKRKRESRRTTSEQGRGREEGVTPQAGVTSVILRIIDKSPGLISLSGRSDWRSPALPSDSRPISGGHVHPVLYTFLRRFLYPSCIVVLPLRSAKITLTRAMFRRLCQPSASLYRARRIPLARQFHEATADFLNYDTRGNLITEKIPIIIGDPGQTYIMVYPEVGNAIRAAADQSRISTPAGIVGDICKLTFFHDSQHFGLGRSWSMMYRTDANVLLAR